MSNRLAAETSPYLLQHADNPVDWFPWGADAFAKARAEDKPILLSVGYSACHWCHVMAHESFEDEATAALMNAHFVSVKVDREERPDVDAVYMNAVQAATGAGGWPMTVVMTPSGQPFFGGTYFPPDDRHGRPSFKRVLLSLADAWTARRGEVLEAAESLTDHLGALAKFPPRQGEPTPEILTTALATLRETFDPQHGGFGGAPKFPPHSTLEFLLLRPEQEAREMALATLRKMAAGGLYDQLGGGFARYSVDAVWLVPHFEKMLYDNAQLVSRYAEAYARTGEVRFKEIVQETLTWLLREMTSPEGGFYSALDADSEGEEGRFYVWSEEEFDALLGEDARLAKAYFGVSSMGNFEGHNVLHTPHSVATVAARFGLGESEVEAKLRDVKKTLLEAREKRVRPGLDDKILLSWNGLMLWALADAGRILERDDFLEVARTNARFLRDKMVQGGRLFHVYKDGEAKVSGLLEDVALFGLGLVALYRATFESEWLELALELAEVIVERFRDEQGGFFSTADDAEALVVRPKDFFDAAVPSSSGASARLLLTLARYTDNRAWEVLVAGTVTPMVEAIQKYPNGFGSLLCALEGLLTPPREVAIFGSKGDPETEALLAVLGAHPLPHAAVSLVDHDDHPLTARLPFLQGRGRVDGKPTAYVCEGGACKLPVTSAEALEEHLKTL